MIRLEHWVRDPVTDRWMLDPLAALPRWTTADLCEFAGGVALVSACLLIVVMLSFI